MSAAHPAHSPEPHPSPPDNEHSDRLAQLRADFDYSFTVAPPSAAAMQAQQDYVLLSAGMSRYALSTAGLASIERAAAVIAAPSRNPALLGLAGVRGTIVPVFSLAGLLGLRVSAEEAWWRAPIFALAAVPEQALPNARGHVNGNRIGLAFDQLLSAVRVPASELLRGETATSLQYEGELFVVLTAHDVLEPLLASASPEPHLTENVHP